MTDFRLFTVFRVVGVPYDFESPPGLFNWHNASLFAIVGVPFYVGFAPMCYPRAIGNRLLIWAVYI